MSAPDWRQRRIAAYFAAPLTAGWQPCAPPGLIPLTMPEIRRLLARLWAAPPASGAVWYWSRWRRRHQAIARFYHYLRRATRQLQL